MFGIVTAYSALVWGWWPTDTMVGGVSLVVYLMGLGLALWVALCVIFVIWVERIEREEEAA